MAQPFGLDPAALRLLTKRLAAVADELATTPVPGVAGLPGSALAGLDAPRRVATEVQRLCAAVQEWAAMARCSAEDLAAADDVNADRLRPR